MNETRFNGLGRVYAAARPLYPDALFDALHSRGLLHAQDDAADVGAGTGLFSAQLARRVRSVRAIEPNGDMRRAGQNACRSVPGAVFSAGTAEHTGLPDGSVDLVTAAQAFHWFDRAAFRQECRRILRPGGRVLLVWNIRDETDPLICENRAVNARFCPGFHGFTDGLDLTDTAQFDAFLTGGYTMLTLPNRLSYDEPAFIARHLSSSYALRPGADGYDAYIQALRTLFRRFESGGTVSYPYSTRCFAGTL